MKVIKSYKKIWGMEGTLYSINDTPLPFPMAYSQIAWFIAGLVFMILSKDIPPFSFINGWLMRYIAIPAGLTFVMNKVEFEGKKPWAFLLSGIMYFLRPKKTYMGRTVKTRKKYRINEEITIVRSEF